MTLRILSGLVVELYGRNGKTVSSTQNPRHNHKTPYHNPTAQRGETGGSKMKTITIEVPDIITINGANDAPESLRNVSTENWTPEFCLTALTHGVSQKIGDTWSVTKKDVAKTAVTHANMAAGTWARRATGAGEAAIAAKIASLDVTKLAEMLSPGQLRALLDMQVQK